MSAFTMATIIEFDRLHELADGLWCCRSYFPLGKDQTEGLSWEGLKNRLLGLLKEASRGILAAYESDFDAGSGVATVA
jgi:hypothetical protein